jgi:hypothetical protein
MLNIISPPDRKIFLLLKSAKSKEIVILYPPPFVLLASPFPPLLLRRNYMHSSVQLSTDLLCCECDNLPIHPHRPSCAMPCHLFLCFIRSAFGQGAEQN